jgi:uncharacterized protein DUF4058
MGVNEVRANPPFLSRTNCWPSRENPLMPSPFPGMNPYLEGEGAWHDFHKRFIPSVASLLGGQLRPRYVVKIDEHIYVHELSAESRRWVGRADVSVGRGSQDAVDRERLSYVEIRGRRDRELVTVVELLSPANKYAGPDREQYLAKRMELPNGPVHLVEIDLLRGGPPLPAPGRPDCS